MTVENDKLSDAVNKLEQQNAADSADDVVLAKADEILAEEKLISDTEERLANLGKGTSTPDEDETESTDESKKDSDKEDSTSQKTDATDESEKESDEDKSTSNEGETKSADGTPKLSDAYYRAAIHQGWKPDEIKEFFTKDPDLATKTFAKLHESTNRLSQEFAAIGRAKQEAVQKAKQEPPKPEPVKKPDIKTLDVEKLKEEYGEDDPLVKAVIELYEQNKHIPGQVTIKEPDKPQVDEATLRLQIQEEASMLQQIDQFFSADELKSYNEFYGATTKEDRTWNKLTDEQKTNRWKLLEMADQILLGAEAQGRKMSIDDVMSLAHLSVSEPIREKVIREDIMSKTVKRGKGLSLQPGSGKPVDKQGPRTLQELEEVTAGRLSKVFKK